MKLVLFVSQEIFKKLIQDNEDNKLSDAIKNDGEHGCQDFNQALHKLYKSDLVTKEVALAASPSPEELRMSMRGISIHEGGIV